jgi:tetratricopeptide (TPR) repeat protein
MLIISLHTFVVYSNKSTKNQGDLNMNNSKEGRRLHSLAELAREEGRFLEALEFTDQASLAYQKDGDIFGLAEVQSSRQSTFKHLFRSTGDFVFLILEKHSAQAAVDIAERSGISEALAIPFHNLGKYYAEVRDCARAAEFFSKAIENLKANPQNTHSRPAVIADIAGHLYWAQYHCGDESALQKAIDILEELKSLDEESYNKLVWITGAHLRIAEMTARTNPELAREHLELAREIINSDKRLVLRAEQLRNLETDLF